MFSTIEFLQKKSVKQIFITGVQKHSMNGVKFIAKYGLDKNAHAIKTPMYKFTLEINNKIENIKKDFIFVNLLASICNKKECERVTGGGDIITYDIMHLTPIGAKYIGSQVLNKAWFMQLTK